MCLLNIYVGKNRIDPAPAFWLPNKPTNDLTGIWIDQTNALPSSANGRGAFQMGLKGQTDLCGAT